MAERGKEEERREVRVGVDMKSRTDRGALIKAGFGSGLDGRPEKTMG